jgi:hypothetical protein
MALRETVRAIKLHGEADAAFEARRPHIIAEWQDQIARLYRTIRGWLSDLEQDGSIQFTEEPVEIREEALGAYTVHAMNIEAGPVSVRLQPAARIIVGAVGRIDMFRAGRSASDERVLLLRVRSDQGEDWAMRLPLASGAGPRDLRPLDQTTFEAALDGLLTT